jgi:hypothetical protein
MHTRLLLTLAAVAIGACQGLRDYPGLRSSGHGGESPVGGREAFQGGAGGSAAGRAGGGASSGGKSSAGGAAVGAAGTGGLASSAGTAGAPAGGDNDADGGTVGTGGARTELPVPICSPAARAGTPESLGLEAVIDGDANFAAITPNEQTLVWTTRQGNNLVVTYLDQSDSDAGLGSPRSIKVDAGDDQVALSPDGLQLVYVSADGQRFQTEARADLTAEFAEVEPIDFRILADVLSGGLRYAEPVYGPEGVSFYFATLDASGNRVRQLSTRPSTSDSFDPARLLVPLGGEPDPAARVTGVSADEQTLFLWDAATGQTLWSFLDADTFQYAAPATLGELGPAQPNAACSRLYAGPTLGSIVRLPLE